jgi:methionyl-tRNA formyltransferase
MKILYFGTPDFAVPSLRALLDSRHEVVGVVAQPDRPSGRGMKMQTPPVAALAMEAGLPLFQPPKLDATFLESARGLAPDLGVVVAYGKILRKSLLDLPPHGFINVHGSLLPKYRGAAPIQRAIEAGETETGVTIMRIDEQLDHGPMFAVSTLTIGPEERTPSLFHRLATAGGTLLVEVIDAIEEGRALEQEQDHASATHAKKIEKEEGRIVWSQPSRAVYDRFRAFDPWPGTFFEHGGEIIKVNDMKRREQSAKESGTIVELGDRVIVACSEGALELVTLQRPGRKAAAAGDVARGLGLAVGQRLQ